jgi:lysophospholipase L1-like esterase
LEPEPEKVDLHPESVALFDTIVSKFQQRGTKIFLVVSPNFGRTVSASSTIEYLRKTSRERDIPLFVYSNDTAFITKPELFVDPDHLNVEGAQIFTQDLIRQIKPFVHSNQLSSHD